MTTLNEDNGLIGNSVSGLVYSPAISREIINPQDNTVVVGTKEDLRHQEMFIRDVNYLKYDKIKDGMQCMVKVRYKHKGEMATITNEGRNLKVLFHKRVAGIAPGQSAVIYEGEDLIAGGFIMKE